MDTDKKHSEGLHTKETWLASFPEMNPNPILEISLDGRIQYANPAVLKIFPSLTQQQSAHPFLANWAEIVERFKNQPDLVISREIGVGPDHFQQYIHFVKEYQRLRVYGMNISGQKQMEAEIKESERKYRELIQYAPVGIYEIDFRRPKFISVNDAMCVLSGYSRDELLAMNPFEILDEHSRQVFKERIKKWLAGEQPQKNFEYRALAKDGHEIYVVLDVSFTADSSGRPMGATVVGYDITERKQKEEALRESEEKFRTLADSSPLLIWMSDANAENIFVNQTYREYFRATSDQLTGKQWQPRIHPDDAPAYIEKFTRAVREHTSCSAETRVRRGDGEWRWIAVYAAPRFSQYHEFLGHVGSSQDITDRKREETLDKGLNRIHQFIHSTLGFDQMIRQVLSEAANTLECDTAVISLLKKGKWIPTYVAGAPFSVLGIETSNDEERHAVLAIQTQQPVAIEDAFNDERFNREHLRKWGIRSVLVVPILLKKKAIGVLFFNYQRERYHFYDEHIDFARQLASSITLALENTRLIGNLKQELSERKKAEKALAEANANLERRVQERTSELRRSAQDLQLANIELEMAKDNLKSQNDELEQVLETEKSLRNQLIQAEKFAALARLLGSVAHEINNPLQTVKDSLYLLSQEIPPGESHEVLEMAILESRRIGALVQRLHETYRPSHHEPVRFNLVELVNKVLALLAPQLKLNNVECQFHSDQDSLFIRGISDQIQQVFLNICINAIDAIGPGVGS